jgi:hypothetical protein
MMSGTERAKSRCANMSLRRLSLIFEELCASKIGKLGLFLAFIRHSPVLCAHQQPPREAIPASTQIQEEYSADRL